MNDDSEIWDNATPAGYPPQEIDAEEAVLSECLINPRAHRTAMALLSDTDWFRPAHETVWKAMRELAQDGALDATALASLFNERKERGALAVMLRISGGHGSPASIEWLCERIIRAAAARELRVLGQRVVQMVDDHRPPEDAIQAALDELQVIQRVARGKHEVLSVSAEDFLTNRAEEPTWVIPGLLAQQDRLVLTGSGGLGKSTLLWLISVCGAAGMDPFDWQGGVAYEPCRVLIADCENPRYDQQTRLWNLRKLIRSKGGDYENRLTIAGEGNPMDLMDRPTAAALLATVEHDKPDLVYLGPFYKLHNDDPDKEITVKKVTNVIDQIRATGAAVIMEAHTGKDARRGGSMEPSGSNMWTWWPEFGVGMRLNPDAPEEMRHCRLERWRIDRVTRSWPEAIETGGAWPWVRSR